VYIFKVTVQYYTKKDKCKFSQPIVSIHLQFK